MNRTIKTMVAACAISAAATVFAEDEVSAEEEGAIGWTPVCVSLCSPVQLPWGHAKWDVFGLDLGILYSGTPKMYGLAVNGLGMLNTDEFDGFAASGLMNFSRKDVYGIRACLGANICEGTAYGLDMGGFGYGKGFWGVDVEFLGGLRDYFWGCQIGGLVNLTKEQAYGWELALGVNFAKVVYGCQTAMMFNMADELHGCQIGLVNFADNCVWGFQIGIVNIIMSNEVKALPIVNAYF